MRCYSVTRWFLGATSETSTIHIYFWCWLWLSIILITQELVEGELSCLTLAPVDQKLGESSFSMRAFRMILLPSTLISTTVVQFYKAKLVILGTATDLLEIKAQIDLLTSANEVHARPANSGHWPEDPKLLWIWGHWEQWGTGWIIGMRKGVREGIITIHSVNAWDCQTGVIDLKNSSSKENLSFFSRRKIKLE